VLVETCSDEGVCVVEETSDDGEDETDTSDDDATDESTDDSSAESDETSDEGTEETGDESEDETPELISEEGTSEEEDEEEIKAEIEEAQTKVEYEFVLDTIDKEEIVSQTAEKLGLSVAEVEAIIEYEGEEVPEEDETEDETEIKVEILETQSEVEFEFVLDTIDKEEIVSQTAEKLGLSVAEVEAIIEYEEDLIDEELESLDDVPAEPTEPLNITDETSADDLIEEVSGEVEDPEDVVEEEVPVPAQLACKVARHTYAIEEMVIRMNGVLDYVEQDLGLNDTTELEAIKNDVYDTIIDAQGAMTEEEFMQVVEQSKELVAEFKEVSTSIEGFDSEAAKVYIDQQLADNEEYLEGIAAERNQTCAGVVLTRFDVFIENTAKILAEMEEAGADENTIASLKTKLDSLIQMRDDLQQALDEGDMETFREIEDAFEELMEELRTKATLARVIAKLNFGQVVTRIKQYRYVVRQAEKKIAELEEIGVDVSSIKAELEDAKALLDQAEQALREAKQKWQDKDYSGAKDSILEAHAILDRVREKYNFRIRSQAKKKIQRFQCGDVSDVLDNFDEELEDAEDDVEELIEEENIDPADLRELIAGLKRISDSVGKAKRLQQAGNSEEACELLYQARQTYGKLKDGVKDYKKVAKGQKLVSASEFSRGKAVGKVMKAIAKNPKILRQLCEENPEKCGEFLENNPELARMIKDRAPEVLEDIVDSGATDFDQLAGIYKVKKTEVRKKIAERKKRIEQKKKAIRERVKELKKRGKKIRDAINATKANRRSRQANNKDNRSRGTGSVDER
jgi:ABC-type transporter Mla subunit MlaD